jgi:dihydroorotate dehydrogenase electron transfer subunit
MTSSANFSSTTDSQPPETPVARRRGNFVGVVAANLPLCREHFKLIIRLPFFPPTSPGQFIQLACRDWDADYVADREFEWTPGGMAIARDEHSNQPPEHVEAADRDLFGDELLAPLALLRRPFSLAGRRDLPDGSVELDIIHRIVGVGTAWLAQLKPCDRVYLLGPLGNRFTIPAPQVEALLVGGGVGIPPMLYLATALRDRKAVAFAGALSRELLPLSINDASPTHPIREFADCGMQSIIATDDGSLGYRGYVTGALEAYLDAHPLQPADRIIYTCGPEPMMQRVAAIAIARGIPCEVAVERAMACGMGTCQSCCIRVKSPNDPAGRPWVYRLACTDGPIFAADDLLW